MSEANPPDPDGGDQHDDGADEVPPARGCIRGGLVAVALMFGLAVTLVGCLAFATSQVSRQLPRRTGTAARGDYAISHVRCVDEGGDLYVAGTIRNRSHRQQGFRITYRFRRPDDRVIGVASNYSGILQPGEATTFDVASTSSLDTAASTCTLVTVRYSNFAPQPS